MQFNNYQQMMSIFGLGFETPKCSWLLQIEHSTNVIKCTRDNSKIHSLTIIKLEYLEFWIDHNFMINKINMMVDVNS